MFASIHRKTFIPADTFLPEEVRTKQVTGILPKYSTPGSAGCDVFTPYPFELKPGEKHFVDTGLIIKIPRDHYIQVAPRSGLSCKLDLSIPNSPGTIDRDYCGADDVVKICLKNLGTEAVKFETGDAIAQMIFVQYSRVDWVDIKDDRPEGKTFSSTFPEKNRGGFGSTGMPTEEKKPAWTGRKKK